MTDLLHNEFAPDSIELRDLTHMLHPTTNLADYHRRGPSVHVRAKGVYLWDNHGKQYLEGMAGLWCTALGYGVEELVEAGRKQLEKLSYSQLFAGVTNEPSVLLAEKLKESVPFNAARVFFGVSGSDANDTQVKLMWHYHNLVGKPQKKKIISRLGSYHGVTIASGSLTGLPAFHRDFDLPIPGILHTDSPFYYRNALEGETEEQFATRLANNLEDLIQAEGPETIAAFIAEPILGAGGVVIPPDGYYEKIQTVLHKYQIHFIDDEIICGFGRTGNPFGCQTMDIKPTTMSLAKALSSAYLPISAVLIPQFMYEPIVHATNKSGVFGHGFTYTGHPVSTAVALRNLQLMEERDIFNHASQMGEIFQQRIRQYSDHPLVGDARGCGLIGAIELVKNRKTKEQFNPDHRVGDFCTYKCREYGLILRPLRDTIAFCPPLIITENQIDELFSKFDRALQNTLEYANSLD